MVDEPHPSNVRDLKAILEHCITENSNEAWTLFLSTFGPLVRRVYHAHADAKGYSHFESWFPGWLYYERKLHAAYRGLQTKIQRGECPTLESQERYLTNYFATIVRTAVAEFAHQESAKVGGHYSAFVLFSMPAPSSVTERDLYDQIRTVLSDLPPELRVPFWLRYYSVFGPLSETDAAWVAEKRGLSVGDITLMVLQEASANFHRQKPLSSEFIGSLLNIRPSADGRYSTVDQRVRRTILRIRESLTKAVEERDQ
jgi:hypothetical protein